MKEGYLQKKLTELSEECQIIQQRITMRKNELELLEQRVGELKDLLKRLKKVEQFNEESLKELKEVNTLVINEVKKNLQDTIQKKLEDSLENKSFLLNKSLNQLEKDAAVFEKNQQVIDEAMMTALFIKEFHHLLMLKLINKGIISHREVKEIEQRAEKHTHKKKS